MAKKATVPTGEIEHWLCRIKFAEKAREQADITFGYSNSIKQYQGDYLSTIPSFVGDVPIIPINEVYSYVKAFLPSVYSRNPYVAVNAKGAQSVMGAKLLELAVNAYWRDLRLKKEVRRAIVDAIFAEGVIKLGYTSALGSIETEDGQPGLEANEFVKNEEIFATRISWKNFVRDPNATDGLHDARWVAHQIIHPFDAVVNSSLYTNTKNLKPGLILNLNDAKIGRSNNLGDHGTEEYVVIYEIWDRDTEKVYAISESCPEMLYEPKDWPYDFDGFPFELLRFTENPDECYAPNLIAPWTPQLYEKIKLRSMQMDHIKRFNRQLSIEKGSMDRAEIDKLTKSKTGSITMRKAGSMPPAAIVYPPFQSDAYAIEGRIDLDKDNVSGQPNAVRSAPQKTQSRTLGEIDRLISAFNTRQIDPESIVEDFCGETAYKIIGLIKQYHDEKKFIRATQSDIAEIKDAFVDMNGESRFDGTGLRFTKQEIQDTEFETEVKVGSTLPLNRENRIESMVSLLKLGPTVGINPGSEVAATIGKNLVAEFELKEVDESYKKMLRSAKIEKELAMQAEQDKLDQVDQGVADARMNLENFKRGGGDL